MAQPTALDQALITLSDAPTDHRAQRNAVRAILPSVISNLRSRVDYETASEIANDTANAILTRALKADEINIGLVFGIARNLYRKRVDLMAAQKRQSVGTSTECHLDQPIEHHEVRDAVTKLPRDTGAVIAARYLRQRTVRQCCADTGLTIQNIRTLERKGLEQLREMLLG